MQEIDFIPRTSGITSLLDIYFKLYDNVVQEYRSGTQDFLKSIAPAHEVPDLDSVVRRPLCLEIVYLISMLDLPACPHARISTEPQSHHHFEMIIASQTTLLYNQVSKWVISLYRCQICRLSLASSKINVHVREGHTISLPFGAGALLLPVIHQ